VVLEDNGYEENYQVSADAALRSWRVSDISCARGDIKEILDLASLLERSESQICDLAVEVYARAIEEMQDESEGTPGRCNEM